LVLVKLFADIKAWTVVPYLRAIRKRVSPGWTM